MKKKNVLVVFAFCLILFTGIIINGFLGGFLVGFSILAIILIFTGNFYARKFDQKIDKFIYHLINKK